MAKKWRRHNRHRPRAIIHAKPGHLVVDGGGAGGGRGPLALGTLLEMYKPSCPPPYSSLPLVRPFSCHTSSAPIPLPLEVTSVLIYRIYIYPDRPLDHTTTRSILPSWIWQAFSTAPPRCPGSIPRPTASAHIKRLFRLQWRISRSVRCLQSRRCSRVQMELITQLVSIIPHECDTITRS
jgi:hypothetical protein